MFFPANDQCRPIQSAVHVVLEGKKKWDGIGLVARVLGFLSNNS